MYVWLLIGIGGFIGAVARYILGGWAQGNLITFPLGTMVVNVLGSFLLGLVMFLTEYHSTFSQEMRIFITIGILGGFTTMSSFSYESFRLLGEHEYWFFAVNVLGTVLLTLIGVYLGRLVALRYGGLV